MISSTSRPQPPGPRRATFSNYRVGQKRGNAALVLAAGLRDRADVPDSRVYQWFGALQIVPHANAKAIGPQRRTLRVTNKTVGAVRTEFIITFGAAPGLSAKLMYDNMYVDRSVDLLCHTSPPV